MLYLMVALDPVNIYKINDGVYFDVTAALKTLSLHKHVKKHDCSFIDKFLSKSGKFFFHYLGSGHYLWGGGGGIGEGNIRNFLCTPLRLK